MSEVKCEPTEAPSETSKETEIIPGYSTIEQFTKDGFKVLMEAIRHSNALPTGRDRNFYNVSESFTKIINDEGGSVLRLMNQIMRCNDIESNIRNRILDEKTELVVEANDVILEKVANNIDEMNGVRKALPEPIIIQTVSAELPINGSWNRPTSATITVNSTASGSLGNKCIKLITAKNIVRPQKFFKDKIDNSNKYPWCPRIRDKPNSLKPLAIFLEEFENENGQEYSHPYEFELDRFTPTAEQLVEEVPEFPRDLSTTPLVEIDKPEQLDDLVETLRTYKEFAVDLEHHSYRSFMGITCLLQISTQDKDYLIDTLALRDKLYILNEVFTKNNIVKIFHGADKDVEWLQRDLSIYVVNMFDTHQAAKVLQYSGLSLAFLMKKFFNVLPDKQFQLADWRIRPLPEEFKTYAREDTHYLIYIYKMLKKELLAKGNKSDNLLRSVIERSTDICKRRYFKPILRDDSHLDLYRKCKKMFDNRQLSHLLELHQILLKARDQPLEKAVLKEHTTGRGVLKKVSKVNVDSALHCPHDLSKSNEFRDDLPTLLGSSQLKSENRNVADVDLTIEKSSSYSIFDSSSSCDEDAFNERRTFKKLRGFASFSPYERYKLVKPFVQEEEKAVQTEKQKEEEAKTKEPVEGSGRTDDERIASIRDHFLQLSKKFTEELEIKKQEEKEKEKSLIEMGGSRKRKRDFDAENDGLFPEPQAIESSLHTPIPNMNKNQHNQEGQTDSQRQPQQLYKKKKKKNRQQQKQDNQNQNNQGGKAQNRFSQRAVNQVVDFQQHENRQKKQKQNERNKIFVPYDYASVDFRQFQGGAGSATGAVNIKSNFKAK
ncbi:exosome component 10, partial [Asbolus verrucosus]